MFLSFIPDNWLRLRQFHCFRKTTKTFSTKIHQFLWVHASLSIKQILGIANILAFLGLPHLAAAQESSATKGLLTRWIITAASSGNQGESSWSLCYSRMIMSVRCPRELPPASGSCNQVAAPEYTTYLHSNKSESTCPTTFMERCGINIHSFLFFQRYIL